MIKLLKKLTLCQKIIGAILISFVLALVIEACFFNFTALQKGNSSVQLLEKDFDVLSLTYGTSDIYTYNFSDAIYAQKLLITVEGAQSDFIYKVSGNVLSNYGQESPLTQIIDSYNPQLSSRCLSLNKGISKLIIKIPQSCEGTLSSVTLNTAFQMNPYRIIFISVTLFLFFLLIFCKELFERNLAIGFGIIGVTIGCCMILFIGTGTPGWDEQTHFQTSYLEVFSSFTSSTALMRDLTVPTFNTFEERTEVTSYLRGLSSDMPSISIDKFVAYNQRSYIGQSAFLLLGRMLHLPADWLYMFGKLGNLLIFILLLAISIHIAKVGKIYIATIGLLPTALFLSSTYTYDSFITGFLILGFVLWLNEMVTPLQKVVWWKILCMILCFSLGSFSKALYIPLLLLILLLPKQKFDNRKQKNFFKLGIILIFLVVLSTFILPVLETTGTVSSAGALGGGGVGSDSRGGATDIGGQMALIFSHPVQYAKLLLYSISSSFGQYVFKDAVGFFAHAGYIPTGVSFVPAILLCTVAFIRPKKEYIFTFSIFQKTFLGILLFGITCFIWTSMYLAFTPVGESVINGVQGRYYIPLLVPMLLLLRNHRICWDISETTYNRLICGILALLSLSGIYFNLLINCI